MKTMQSPSALPELGVRASHSSPVIIATDGRGQSDSALAVGRLFAHDPDAIRVVTVVKPMPTIPDAPSAVTPDLLAELRAGARRDALAQMARTWDGDEGELEVRDGDPATVVARLAHSMGATMIVCGLGRHRISDRVFGDETALRLIRMADVPVFAASSGLAHAPRRVVVACDFAETSLRAARLALEVAASGATIYLVHVVPRDAALYEWKNWGATYKHDAGEALRKTREQLRPPRDMTVQNVLLQGDPATELLAFATSVNADLIATGSHGYGYVRRMLVGSVTTRIVRCSTCSVLTVPLAAAMTGVRTTVEPPEVSTLPGPEWPAQLQMLTRRNFGRRGTLEIDDPDIDAQAQVIDYPLLGAAYDPHDECVELMFGDPATGGRHLTHAISGVTSIVVLRDEKQRDLAVRIAHGAGLTLLSFTS